MLVLTRLQQASVRHMYCPPQRPSSPPPTPHPSSAVWFMGLASGAVAMASCTINDYFDADIDAVNDPHKPVG